jgi:hypothetical protein
MRGLEPRRTSYAGAAVELFPERKRFKKGGTSAPPGADPSAVAGAQLNANIGTAQAQSALNNVRTTSPLGTSFFEQGPDGRWSLNQTLDPSTAPVYGAQTGLAATLAQQAQGGAPWVASGAQGGGTLIDQALRNIGPAALNPAPTLQRNLDFSSLGPLPNPNPADFTRSLDFTGLEKLPTSSQDFGRAVTDAQNAAYNTQAGYLDPQFAQKGSDLRQQLADEGIGVGTQAYSRAQGDLGRQSTLAYQQAQDAAVAAGQAEQQRLFGEALSGRQQGVNEALTSGQFRNQTNQSILGDLLASRTQGANEIAQGGQFANTAAQQGWQDPLTALASLASTGTGITGSAASNLATLNPLSGFEWAGALPTFGGSPTAVSPANVVGAQNAATTANAVRFNAANTLNNTLFNGLGTLGGAALSGTGPFSANGAIGPLFGAGGLFSSGGGGAIGSLGPAVTDLSAFSAAPAVTGAAGFDGLSTLGSFLPFLGA